MYQYIKVMWLSISFRLLQYQTYANEHKRKWLLITWQYLTATSDLQAAPLYISSCLLLKSDVCFLGVVLVVVFSVCLSSERRQLKSPRACFVPVAHCSSGSQLRLMGRSCLFYFFPPLIFMHNGALLVCVFSCKWKWLCCFLMGRALTSPVCLRKVFVFHFHVSVKRSSTLQCVCVFCVCVCMLTDGCTIYLLSSPHKHCVLRTQTSWYSVHHSALQQDTVLDLSRLQSLFTVQDSTPLFLLSLSWDFSS